MADKNKGTSPQKRQKAGTQVAAPAGGRRHATSNQAPDTRAQARKPKRVRPTRIFGTTSAKAKVDETAREAAFAVDNRGIVTANPANTEASAATSQGADAIKQPASQRQAQRVEKKRKKADKRERKHARKLEKKQRKQLTKDQDKQARQAPIITEPGAVRKPHDSGGAAVPDAATALSRTSLPLAADVVAEASGAGRHDLSGHRSDRGPGAGTAPKPKGPVVATTQGRVEGIIALGVRTWRGIPFGRDTSGSGRFRAPHPANEWSGVRPAGNYGPVALQPTYGPADRLRGSEDCLNLDIVRPDTDEVLPVVVYFHGGSFIYGSSHEQLLRGHYLAESMKVVYVAINFRLGALGYLDMRTFGDDCVANPAVYDQLLALRWIRENIAAFGGDPGNVTVMGESAGGAAVLTLMCVPSAKGLFHKAIAQSPPIATIHSQAQSTMWAHAINNRLGLGPETTLSDLRRLPAGDLVRAGQSMLWRTREIFQLNSCYAPTVDHRIIHDHPLDVFAKGEQHKIPLLVGTNGDEASFAKGFYLRQTARGRAAERMLAAFDPAGAPGVLAAYSGAERRSDFAELLTDAVFWAPAMRVANAHAVAADTWMYRFDFAPAILRWMGLGAMHSTELTPVFGDMTASRMSSLNRFGGREALLALRDEMQYHWSQFIHHSAPGSAHAWPRYVRPTDTDPGRATKVFDATSRIVYDPNRYRRRAWRNYDMREWGTGRPDLLVQLGLADDTYADRGPVALPPGR